MIKRIALGSIVLLALAACSDAADTPTATLDPLASFQTTREAPLQIAAQNAIPDEYIVVLQDGQDPDAVVAAHKVAPGFSYRHTIRGFSATLTRSQIARLRRDSRVKYIAENVMMHIDQEVRNPFTVSPQPGSVVPSDPSIDVTQPTPGGLWGLDRLDNIHTTSGTYLYTNTGKGVKVYVMDTGGNFGHNDFDGLALNRYKNGYNFINPGTQAIDDNGHGTHVAGTIGGTTYGVAKGVTMYAVKVCDSGGSCPGSAILAGIDWITFNHLKPAVANASLGGGYWQPENDAMTKSILYGVTWVVSAGNENTDACTKSPASTPLALTVMASDINDNKASFSNYGPCADIYAPGVSVLSAWIGSNTATATLNGTSMASPHVAGLAALFLQSKTTATPAEIADVLKLNANQNQIVGNPAATANLLAQQQIGTCGTSGAYCGRQEVCGTPQQWPMFSVTSTFPNCYFHTPPGMQWGWVRGTPGTDFDIEFYSWKSGVGYVLKKAVNTSTTNPFLKYISTCDGAATCDKMYRVKSKYGTGNFTFWHNRQ